MQLYTPPRIYLYSFGHACPDVLVCLWKWLLILLYAVLLGDSVSYVKQLKFIRLVMGECFVCVYMYLCVHVSICLYVCVLAALRSGAVSWFWCDCRLRRQLSPYNFSLINRHLIQCVFSGCVWAGNSIHNQFLVQHSASEYLEGLPLNSLRDRLPILE